MDNYYVDRWVNGHWCTWCKCYTKESAEVCGKALSKHFSWEYRIREEKYS